MTALSKARLTAVLLAGVLVPLALHADPVTVTGGSVQVAPGINSARITFIGDDFMVSTGTADFVTEVAMSPFPLGTPVTLGGVWQPSDLRGGEALVEGVSYPPSSEIRFGAGSSGGTFVTDPVTLEGHSGLVVLTVPFTFSGLVTGLPAWACCRPADPLFSIRLVGSGFARAAFFFNPELQLVDRAELPGTDFSLEYVFTSRAPAPIPEPGTLALVGGGALAVAIGRRLRRGPGLRRDTPKRAWRA